MSSPRGSCLDINPEPLHIPDTLLILRRNRWLSEAKEARDSNPERLQVCLFEAKEHYLKVSMDLTFTDLGRMCDCFLELRQHISALEVLLKRFAEQVSFSPCMAILSRSLDSHGYDRILSCQMLGWPRNLTSPNVSGGGRWP